MLTIINSSNNRQTDYSKDYLEREAKHYAKHASDSDGKLRAWGIVVLDGTPNGVCLRVDYLTREGQAKSIHIAI